MLGQLFRHQWKESARSPLWQKQLVINIIIGFLLFYLFLNVLVLGIFLDKILIEIFDEDPVIIFNSGLLYYLLIDLILRLYFQELPVMSIQPYLLLPIRKSKLISYMLLRALFGIFNFLPLIILIPFTLKAGQYGYSGSGLFFWFVSIVLFILANNYIATYLKRLSSSIPSITLLALLVIAGLMVLDYFGILSLSHISSEIFLPFLSHAYLIIIPLALLGLFYWLNYRQLLANMYIEDIAGKKNRKVTSRDIPWLRKLGEAGQMIGLQIKLITRHKRPKSVLYMSAVFILYPLLFYSRPEFSNNHGLMIFVGIFASGMFMLSYGQFLLSWESGYFDAILCSNISSYEYFRSKYILFVASCLIAYLFTLPYVYFGIRILFYHTAMLLYNIGIGSFIVLFFATIDPKKIDLTKRAAFNWQGMSGSQFLMMLPILLPPIFLYLPLRFFGSETLGLGVLAGISVISIFCHKIWLRKLAARLQRRKYKIADSFRDQ